MKITFIAQNYLPSYSGVVMVIKYLAEELASQGEKVTIITLNDGNQKKIDWYNNVEVRRYNIKRNKLKQNIGETNKYIQDVLARNDDVTIFECTETITTDLLLPYLKQIKGKKILHAHGFFGLTLKPFKVCESFSKTLGNTWNYFYWKNYYNIILPKYLDNFDAVISLCKSDNSLPYFEKRYHGKRYILGNAAVKQFFVNEEIKESNPLKKYTNINKEYFLSVANYGTLKNQIGILKQYEKTSAKKRFDMVFIGTKENDYCKKLKRKLVKYTDIRNNVHILYNVERSDIKGIIQGAYLYLVGSQCEQYSISIIEALSQGIPFISTNVGNARELPGGVVVENINKMSTQINNLILDKQKYELLSQKGKEYAYENCQISKCIKKIKTIIRELS